MNMKQYHEEMVRTHGDMLELLTYSALGAEVKVSRIKGNGNEDTSAMRSFTITMGGINPMFAASQTHIYSLPCSARQMQTNVKEILKQLHSQMEKAKSSI